MSQAALKEAEEDRIDAEMKADRDKKNAVQAEKDRAAAEKQREQEATAKREANKKHKTKINREARDAIKAHAYFQDSTDDMAFQIATQIVEAIARGEIPHVKIEY